MDFQARILREAKTAYGFNVQVVCSLVRGLAGARGKAVSGTTVFFNVPRNCKTFETKEFFFVRFGLYPGKRLCIPIRRNREFQRFQCLLDSGWTCKTYGLTPSLEIVANLSIHERELQPRKNVLGIDINAKNFAYTVLTPESKILNQGYLGQQMWNRRHHFAERRAMLQSLRALKKLKQMSHRQRDYIKTNLGQMVRGIINVATRYNADVSIENLSRFKPKGRRFNKKVMTIPFSLFQRILEGRCFDNGITLNKVDAYHTSKWCTHCGAVGNGHDGSNYALFRCKECGQVVNSDRKASLAVAVKTFLERNDFPNHESFQISGRRVSVSGLVRPSPMIPDRVTVSSSVSERGKPTGLRPG